MVNRLRFVNLTIILSDNRILLRKDNDYFAGDGQWTSTIESFISLEQDAATVAKSLLYDKFKVRPPLYKDSKVEFKTLPAINSIRDRFVLPFIAKIHSHMNFLAKRAEQYQVLKFEDLLSDIYRNTVYPMENQIPKHTTTCVHVAKALQEEGIFDT